jgi:hypothetical protein
MLATPATAATRRLDPEPATPISPQPVVPRRRPAQAATRPPITPQQPRSKRSAASRFGRAIGVLLLIAILAAVIAGAVLLLTDAGQNTDIGQTIKDYLNDQIQAIEDFIRNNTQ